MWLKARSGSEKDPGFLNAFVSSSLVVCIGAMAVVGAVEDGLSGNIAMLEAKAVLDAIIIMVMAVPFFGNSRGLVSGKHDGLGRLAQTLYDGGCAFSDFRRRLGDDFLRGTESCLRAQNPCSQHVARLGFGCPLGLASHLFLVRGNIC